MSSVESEVSRDRTPTPPVECSLSPKPPDLKQEITHTIGAIRGATPTHIRTYTTEGAVGDLSVNMVDREVSSQDEKPAVNTVVESRSPEERLQPERKRRASDEISLDSSTKASECGKDDDDDEDGDDDDDKIPAHGDFDPERLKAFNMFVRLFVDENLDRMVPISKQPKDKIQAILEACDRQFPEFHERSRKRIRTYLKSCRRMRRSKENGWESLRPTPPHLTSAAAESILAQACENESNNAKRMRMGLEPLPATSMNPVTVAASTASQPQQPPQQPSPACQTAPAATQPAAHQPSQPQQPQPPHLDRQPTLTAGPEYIRHAPPTAFRPPHEIPSPFFTNGNGIFRPGFPATYHGQHPAHHHAPVIQHTQMTNTIQNGPTDLSMKSKSQGSSKNQLNPSEVATIKQLIAGYRESAAFLYRSADELEQLLLQQN